jgi:hypothetical protein
MFALLTTNGSPNTIKNGSTEHAALEVTIYICNREVFVSNLDRDAGYGD